MQSRPILSAYRARRVEKFLTAIGATAALPEITKSLEGSGAANVEDLKLGSELRSL